MSAVTFALLLVNGSGWDARRPLLTVGPQRRLVLFHLDQIVAARVVNLRGGFGVAVMRIKREFLPLKLGVL